ncbi:MAG: DNA polymerase III subunit alpha [Candidatus Levybacteria bacterium RIFCSPLOWO2_01_FULL_39_24]|nr:MAG: DNA polymerase III subunit alpha [Candidatus Levybacteria bacterium RIFCSPHIGHO2_01_FULL_40_16]OGH28667.1 MAG: DNA polymerase III subunit alpha [Candidatus Levybacteria bacterium RIFCSPHIGHO2_12_FULL_39_9]OGH46429.1 MAG: DNA polymerase III subunit alpha [Candidatus Levybacteria bacterium RIFCSPLOWO2_01_FULL_39_24]
MADFVHLHNHSEFSLLDGLSKIKDMVGRAKELGMKAIAITDHGNMYGAIKFYKICIDEGIKPIIGCEIYVSRRSRHDKEAGLDTDSNHLILLAKNNVGYKNLMKIISIANLEGYYYRPRTDMELLKTHHEGLICLSSCVNGFVSEPLLQNQEETAKKRAQTLSEIFGKDNFYLEIQKHIDVKDQDALNEKLINLSQKLGIPLVATNDNHYVSPSDAQAQEILLCIQTQTTIDTKNRKLSMISSPDFYIKSQEEMTGLFIQTPAAIENTVKIADMCNIEITLGKWIMPVFDVPNSKSPAEYIQEQVKEGLKKRYKKITEQIKERTEYELSVILKKGYETYILIVADFVNWAKSHGITVGPGRGSNAGSIVSYALEISDVDPLFFKLPFERFLNPMRPSPPDIDLDFADNRRDEVIEYVTEKYGRDKVAQIITFGTMEARGSVRDTGRALGMPYSGPDRISKMIPPGWQGRAMTIEKALDQSPELKIAYQSEPETRKLLDLAKRLEGVARHASMHAAGVVIADKPLTEYTPLQKETNGEKIITQYDMYTVGEDGVGLLKIDFLGLRNLTIIQESLRFIKENQQKNIDLSTVTYEDKKTYELLSSGETTGIFQLESSGMRRYIKDLKPTSIFDLQAMVALYRPGPMANIPEFIRRKHNPSLIKYPDPRLSDILKESYGVITFQDDVLLTAIKVAGYSWLEADKLRKAIGKKITADMKKQHDKFVEGCIANGMVRKKAEEFWILFEPFAGYGFNKAHAAGYATIAFRTAYLKAHYPVEFMTALLTAESRGTTGPVKNEKIAQAVAECRRLKVTILPPDINKSHSDFSIENKINIRFGLTAIKNVGVAAIKSILDARKDEKFKSFGDFCFRVDLGPVNKKTIESLIKAGAMDTFGNRASLLMYYPEIVDKAHKKRKQEKEGQTSLFNEKDGVKTEDKSFDNSVDDFSPNEKLAFEKEFLGLYLTSHPQLDNLIYVKSAISHEIEHLPEEKEGAKIKIGGIIESIRRIFTKKNNSEMAFLVIANEKGISVECVVFPRTFEQYKSLLVRDSVIIVEGHLDTKNDLPSIIAEKISSVNHLDS